MIGLVEPSGSGKTILTKIMNRFYDVSSGEILMDGVNIKDLEVGSMRSQIAVVHQDLYLFHGTILENITYGKEKATLAEVINACRIANAHEFILGFKDGYDTMVGERGQTLSGGERQRISIARPILNDPKISILDEATSAVDTETERKIQDAFDKLIEGRTVIAIAHRLSTLRKANRILVVKAGEIEEVGTHQELMAKDKKLFFLNNKTWWEVDLKPCFPTSQTDKYFSIRDEKGNELGLLETLENLDEENKIIIENYLAFKNFVFEIEGIYTIEENFGLRHFEVKIKKGDRCFQTALDNLPYKCEDGSVVIDCLHGEQYLITDLQFAQKFLMAYL